MSTPTRDHLRQTHGERGASLIIALVFISVFGILLGSLSGFADTNSRATSAYRSQRATNYATDAALDAAVNRVAHTPTMGVDPALSPTDVCNPANNATVLAQPASSTAPKIVVSCSVAAESGSGQPAELGDAPPYALLTLGDRRTTQNNGTVSTTPGVRNTEPPPYNVNSSDDCASLSTGGYQEFGIRQNSTIMPGRWLFFFPTCGYENDANYDWGVRGNLFSNSRIQIDSAGAVPEMVGDPDGGVGTIEARGGCTGLTCTDPGWDFSDSKGRDPGLVTPAAYPLPSLSGLTVQSVPPVSECTNARKLVTFTPGIYTDAKALNDLFGNASCKLATFWFKPADPENTPEDPTDDVTGKYYFDFRNTTTSSQCGRASWLDFIPDITQNTTHQWCISGAADDYAQRVIGGTPFNWAPDADPITSVLTLLPEKAGAGPGTFFGLFPQPTQFVNGDSCPGSTTSATLTECGKLIDGKTVNYAFGEEKAGSSVWMSNHLPKVPRGSYSNIDLELAQAAVNPTRMNAPTIQVRYQTVGFLGLKTTGTCGPYTLPLPTTSLTTIKLSDVNPAAAVHLSGCLNTGDRINSAVVQYNVNRPGYQDEAPYATAKLDGARILVTAPSVLPFPRQPSETDPGGDCDPTAAGVQFVFGGDSHVYLPNGGMELCAGPNQSDPLHGQQLAVYGVPATPRLLPTGASGGTNPNNAKVIAEVPTLQYAAMATGGAVTLSYPGLATPSGYTVAKVEMRASFDALSAATASIRSGATEYCANPFTNALTHTPANPVETKTIDVTSCLTTGNRLASAFDVRWTAGATGVPLLDGVEFIVTLSPTDPNTTLRPQSGCITASPDYWFGAGQGVSPDCAMLRVDARFQTPAGGIFGGPRQGRLSVKGSIYAPSGVVDIDDADVWYPIASRGIVARHLRIRGFRYHDGYNEPAFNSYVDKTESTRQVSFLACKKDSGPCTLTDPTLVGRAAVAFEAETGNPSIQAWSIGKL